MLALATTGVANAALPNHNGSCSYRLQLGIQLRKLRVQHMPCAYAIASAVSYLSSADLQTAAIKTASTLRFLAPGGNGGYRWTCRPKYPQNSSYWVPTSCRAGRFAAMSFEWSLNVLDLGGCRQLQTVITLGGPDPPKVKGIGHTANTDCSVADRLIEAVTNGATHVHRTGAHSWRLADPSGQVWRCSEVVTAYAPNYYAWDCFSTTWNFQGTEVLWLDPYAYEPNEPSASGVGSGAPLSR